LAPIIEAFAREASPELLPPEVAAQINDLVTEPTDATAMSSAASATQSGTTITTSSRSGSQHVPTTSISEIVKRVRGEEPPS